jgi:hypothetical protein
VRRCRLLFDIDHVASANAAASEHPVQGGLAVATRYPIMPFDGMRAATAVRACIGVRNRLNTGNDADIRVEGCHHNIQVTRQ